MNTACSLDEFRAELARVLEREAPSRKKLVDFVHLVDGQIQARITRGDTDDPVVIFGQICLAHAAAATSEALVRALPRAEDNIRAAAAAAQRYVMEPSEASWDELFAASTACYPFGPGDGCHALEELGGHDAFGSGSFSGAGFLASVAETIGDDVTMAALGARLLPALQTDE